MSIDDEAERLRVRNSILVGESMRPDPELAWTAPCLAARTTTLNSYPTAAKSFYACNALTILGPEVEGGLATLTTDSTVLFALNLGSSIPPSNTNVLVSFVGNRWVFHYDG